LKLLTIFLFSSILITSLAGASEEGILPLGKFSLSSDGLDNSGSVTVTGSISKTGFASLSINAFGKTVDLNKKQLALIDGMMVNGIQMTFEEGYKEMGGKTVYVQFSRGFSSGIKATKVISVNEAGEIKVE
jgi:hypothetical protein